ncbi:MAG: hypothetical protein NTX73_10250 [Rhodobacterales bacterium]|jgi:hypothetical protein|nr:hypothetical protein [Rhodobacterales bacterium]
MKRIAALLLLATPAAADEVWNSNWGQVVYQADIGSTAVLSVPYATGMASLYIQGLGGNADQRGVHQAYWISTETGPCEATMTGPDGVSSTNWGVATVIFDKPEYPSGFTVLWGICMDPTMPQILRATF